MKKISILLLGLFFVVQLWAQDYTSTNKKAIKTYKKAEELLRARDFDNGIIELEKALKYDPNFIEPRMQLASIYKMFKNETKTLEHYEKLYELTKGDEKYVKVWRQLADFYVSNGDYEKAIAPYEDFVKYSPVENKGVELKLASAKFAIEAIKNPLKFDAEPLPNVVNRYQYQSNPVLTADGQQLIFSVRGGNGAQYNENIVISFLENGEWTAPRSISNNINTEYNEGFASISGDGKTLVFTSCNKKDGQGSCDIYISYKQGKQWSEAENLGPVVNSPSWESGASVSADGRTIYFSSERKGGKGKKDIWVTYKEGDQWTSPLNLGDSVNSEFNEVTPFIHANGQSLYFASDGYPGMGGYDLFTSEKNANGLWTSPKNLGYPLNTKDNEGSLFLTPDFKFGYFEKYIRDDRQDYSLLYKVELPLELKNEKACSYSKGIVTDLQSSTPIGTTVELFDLDKDTLVQKVESDSETGEYLVVLEVNKRYGLFVEKEGYLFYSRNFNTSQNQSLEGVNLDVQLTPIEVGNTLVLNNVFFEKRSAELNAMSKAELEKLAELILKNANAVFQIEGHTDNVGTDDYNQNLSAERAASVKKYLLSLGVDDAQLKTIGYGESKPVATNDTEEGKALNRRIEVRVVKK